MGPKCNVATCVEELGSTKSYWRSKRHSKRVKVPNLAQANKSELLVAVKRSERPSIPSIYAQRLLMGPTYHVATYVEELGRTKIILEEQTSFKEGQSAKPGPGSQIGAVGCCEAE